MTTRTHYEVLGLAPDAPLAVIRAAYKALALVYHPDKTVHLSPDKRSEHATVFRDVQAAFDVLGVPSMKTAYDNELERHGNKVDSRRSTFHRTESMRHERSARMSTPKHESFVRMTTKAEKMAMKAKIEDQLAQLKLERKKRDEEDDSLTYNDLKYTLKLWKDMADEEKSVPSTSAYCQIRIHEYERKIQFREHQHDKWLNDISKPKSHSPEQARSCQTHPTCQTPASTDRIPPRVPRRSVPAAPATPSRKEEQIQAAAESADRVAARAQARADEKARQEILKRERLESKAAAVRADKEIQKKRTEMERQKVADRIAFARAKAQPAGTRPTDESKKHNVHLRDAALFTPESANHKQCSKCDGAHHSLAEWKKCSIAHATSVEAELTFFPTCLNA